jgi:hypothetical protein
VRRHAKAPTAGSTQRQAGRLGRFFRGAFASRGAALASKGSGAPAVKRLVIPVGVFAALIALLVFAIPASATKLHPFKEVFGSSAQPSFGNARGMAIDQSTGDVLVMDAGGTPSIKRYNPDGTAANFSALGTNVIDGKGAGDETPQNGLSFAAPSESQIAVDNSGTATDGDIYVTQSSPKAINIFASTGAYLGQLTKAGVTNFNEACGVAVDPAGAVYVGDYSGGIRKFVPSANPPINADNTATFTTTTQPCTLAAGAGATAGFLFPARYSNAISKIDSGTGELKYTVSADSNTTVTVDPSSGHVYAATGSTIKEFDASGAGSATTVSTTALASGALGIAVRGSSGDIFASGSGNANVEVFGGSVITAPAVTTNPATGIGGKNATLNGTVNPDGVELTECFFEWGTTTGYGNIIPCAETPAEIGTGTGPVAVHADLSGLAPSTNYNFRLVATNPSATTNGSNQSFATLGLVITTTVTNNTGTHATLNGTVNPDGVELIECFFEWGTTNSYGSIAPCAETPAEIGTGTGPVAVHADLSGLAPQGTVYYFRLAAVYPAPTGTATAFGQNFATPNTVITTAASSIASTSATLNGMVNPDGVAMTQCLFEWGPEKAPGLTTQPYPETAPCVPNAAGIGTGTSAVAVHADLSGLDIGSVYHFRLRAADASGPILGLDESLKTTGPVIAAAWATNVVRTEATLKAQINPEAQATSYRFEWGTDASYGSETAESAVGSDSSQHTVSNALGGLQPGTTYHYRVVATNSVAENLGPDQVFKTYALVSPNTGCPNQVFRFGSGGQLPDCRAYEMVSPVDKDGGNIAVLVGGNDVRAATNQSSLNGAKMAFSAAKSFGDALSSPYISQYLASRDDGEGWTTHSINPPSKNGPLTIGAIAREFQAFSLDLSVGWVKPEDGISLAPGAAEGTYNIYKRDNSTGTYETLTIGEQSEKNNAEFQGATPDSSHAIFVSGARLTPDAAGVGGVPHNLYEWADGQLRYLAYLPNGEPYTGQSSAGFETFAGVWAAQAHSVRHAISDDGSRVYWSAGGYNASDLYLRENSDQEQSAVAGGECTEPAKACTVPVAHTPGGVEQGPKFWGASSDGSRAIYSIGVIQGSTSALDLYEFDANTKTSTPIASDVKGVVGMSDDLSYLYFTSKDVLDTGAAKDDQNLYLYHSGSTRFIATLSSEDTRVEGSRVSAIQIEPYLRDSAVTADGRHVVFISDRSLTGYDNTDDSVGSAVGEVFRYDADGDELDCVSCNPSGARPSGSRGFPKTDDANFLNEDKYSAWIPPFQSMIYQARLVSDDGNRVFFNSFDALVPRDSNGVQDAYEWEAPGTGDCVEGDPSFSAQNGGCISLLSSGESPRFSEFVDATPSGDDAFIRTASSFVPQDPGLYDIYDARVGGGFAQPAESTPCVGDACQSAPEPPNDPTPASASFRGAGDPTPKKARRSCRARHRHAAKGKRRAETKHTKRCKRNNRRAGR